jgi:hypothetical protein
MADFGMAGFGMADFASPIFARVFKSVDRRLRPVGRYGITLRDDI